LLFQTKDEWAYIVMIVGIVALLFWIEYEWFIRPDLFFRRDRSMHVGHHRPVYYDDFEPDEPDFAYIIKGYSFRMMSVSNDHEREERVQEFQSEFESKKKECRVLIVNSTSDPDKWMIAGFNDEEEFKSRLIVDPNSELSVELKKGPTNEIKIVELVTSNLGRTLTKGKQKQNEIQNEILKYSEYYANIRERRRDFEKLTFLHHFTHLHLSIIVTTINLGFEKLDHRSVIHAMLLGIREEYHKKFVSLRNPIVMMRSVFGLFLAMILVTALAREFFNINEKQSNIHESNNNQASPEPSKQNATSSEDGNNSFKPSENDKDKVDRYIVRYLEKSSDLSKEPNFKISEYKKKILINKYCRSDNKGYESLPKAPRLLCELGGFSAEKILPFINFELITIDVNKDEIPSLKLLNWLFDIRTPYYDPLGNTGMSLCVYHLTLFALVFYLFRRLNRTFGFVPYGLNLEKIENLLDALTSTTRTRKNRDFPMAARWVFAFSGAYQENEKSVERGNLDPRAVELEFMRVLEQISHSRPIYFKPLQSGEYSPSIEITFVFDELDKLATGIDSQGDNGHSDSNDSELHRLNLMKGLLSDMKRIITSSEARYIFLGGRLLHDDWLADGARRQPLLTSIFSDEIYLASLLCDIGIDSFGRSNPYLTLKNNKHL